MRWSREGVGPYGRFFVAVGALGALGSCSAFDVLGVPDQRPNQCLGGALAVISLLASSVAWLRAPRNVRVWVTVWMLWDAWVLWRFGATVSR